MRYTEQFGPLFQPNDLKGAGTLSNRYLASDMPDDSYMYLPELRRVRRISVSNRSDAFWGTDYDLDALWGFNSKVSFWTFRLLAEKEILAPMHAGGYGERIWCARSFRRLKLWLRGAKMCATANEGSSARRGA